MGVTDEETISKNKAIAIVRVKSWFGVVSIASKTKRGKGEAYVKSRIDFQDKYPVLPCVCVCLSVYPN